nr:MAG: hypothetical protein E2P08_02970 [Acidobacteriota bacterium]
MIEQMELFHSLYRQVEAKYPEAVEKLKVSETVRRVIDVLVTSLVSQTGRVLETHGIRSVKEVRQFPSRLLGLEDRIASQNRELKDFLHRNLYNHEVMRQSREKAQRLLEGLFRFYLEKPQRLPESHFSRIDILGPERVVCDYIAGMTDKYAQVKYDLMD